MATEEPTDTETDAGIGQPVKRREDPEILLGEAKYTDDFDVPGMVHVDFVRSQQGHAKIKGIDTSDAEAIDGVIGVYTARDIEEGDAPTPGKSRLYGPAFPGMDHPPEHLLQEPIADDKVRYNGEVVAVVVAKDRFSLHDAIQEVDVEYDPLEVVTEPADAIKDDAPAIHEETPDNTVFDAAVGTDEEEVDEAFDNAAHTATLEKDNQRIWSYPMEPRACLAEFNPTTEELAFTATTQNPHEYRRDISHILGYPQNKIEVVSPDMGGGFGPRLTTYPEDILTAWSALQLERPVKWRSKRVESQMVEGQGRGLETESEIAIDEDGNITALRTQALYDHGAWISGWTVGLAGYGTQLMTGQYDIPAARMEMRGVLTNTARVEAYRGVTEVGMILILEQLVNKVARKAGVDPAELRRQNFIDPDDFPYPNPVGGLYDSGEYEENFDLALDLANYDELRERQEELREEGRYIGIGISSFIEAASFGECGVMTIGGWEYSHIQVQSDGKVTVHTGGSNHGQGHKTSLAQVASDKLEVPFEDVEIVQDDTRLVPEGVGTYASRVAAVGGGAIAKTTEKILDKARRAAAHMLEVAEDDIVYEDGEFHVEGAPQRMVTFEEVSDELIRGADIPEDMEPGLEAHTYYDPENFTWPYGTHIPVVEVDPDTGEFEFEHYIATEDCGVQLNPMIVEGQIHGGTAQGLGQALFEETIYDENGQLLNPSLMDYPVPKAKHVPELEVGSTETPSPHNPLGVKGVGECGTIAAPAAITTAVNDALEPFDAETVMPPLTPDKIWKAIDEAGGDS